jgi:hypothetical protein
VCRKASWIVHFLSIVPSNQGLEMLGRLKNIKSNKYKADVF